jgi:hypothetical protein
MKNQIITALVAASVSAIVSLTIAWLQLRQNKQSQRNLMQQEIIARYDKMVDYRMQYPEVLTLAKQWNSNCFTLIYDQKTKEDKAWAIYYGYVELLISYCNSVLYATKKKLIDRDLFKVVSRIFRTFIWRPPSSIVYAPTPAATS